MTGQEERTEWQARRRVQRVRVRTAEPDDRAEAAVEPRLCDRCGFLMLGCVGIGHDQAPRQGSLSVCGDCGLPFTWDHGAWRPACEADLRALPRTLRRDLAFIEACMMMTRRPRKVTLQ